MAHSTAIQNFRANRKLVQEKNNAAQTTVKVSPATRPLWAIPFALAFVGLLASLMGIGAPAQAADLNLSWVVTMFESIFSAATNAMPSFEAFIDAGFPLLIKIGIYGALLGIIALAVYFCRELIMRVLGMIGLNISGKGK